jgi:YfiH family protein
VTEPITASCLSGLAGIRHGFFTRQGGVSTGIYRSLNCGHGSSDARDSVTENRRRVARSLGQSEAVQVLTLYQVHSALALVVDRPLPREYLPKADALVTRTPGLVLGALAADCAPVLFADAQAGVVAAAHAGWRGAFTGVLEATIDTMESLGASRLRIAAAIGPCINQPAYEVGPEFEAQFLMADPTYARFFDRPGPGARPRFDLPAFIESRLAAAGLPVIERRSPCTFADEQRFFSYRRTTRAGEPDYGRQISAIVLA